MRDAATVRNPIDLPLFWRICLINGAVFTVAMVVLAVSPATVSYRIQPSEAGVLAAGLLVILVLNAVLLHTRLAPLDRLCRLMADVDLLRPGQRVPEAGSGGVAHLVRSFNEMLTRLEAERASSAAQALAATEAERQRIARELHDEIGQSLTVVLLGLKRVADRAPADLSDDLRLIQDAARSSLEDMRLIARRLRPGVLQDLGLHAALAALASEFSTHAGIPVRRSLETGLPQLTQDAELVIYRVVQEGLTNAARHSGARHIDLSLSRAEQGDGVALRIADDGRGLRDAAEGGGIRGMRERAILIGADFAILPRLGGGTQVCMVVPTIARAGPVSVEVGNVH